MTSAPAVSTQPTTPASDPIAELERLGNLRAQGVLTDTEFEAAKAKFLAP
jgi:hypothetical protein